MTFFCPNVWSTVATITPRWDQCTLKPVWSEPMTKSPNKVKDCRSNIAKGNKELWSCSFPGGLEGTMCEVWTSQTTRLGFGSQPRCLVWLTMPVSLTNSARRKPLGGLNLHQTALTSSTPNLRWQTREVALWLKSQRTEQRWGWTTESRSTDY